VLLLSLRLEIIEVFRQAPSSSAFTGGEWFSTRKFSLASIRNAALFCGQIETLR
jgi:hypothetical protein